MAYRNPLAWDKNMRPGLFKACSQDEPLPRPDMGLHIGLYDGSLGGFDWLGEENNTSFTYSDMELDMMIAELNELGYGDMMGSGVSNSDGISFDVPGRHVEVNIWRSHHQ